jgi:hypothetical protein
MCFVFVGVRSVVLIMFRLSIVGPEAFSSLGCEGHGAVSVKFEAHICVQQRQEGISCSRYGAKSVLI